MSFLIKYLRPYRKLLVGVLILASINQIFSLLSPQVLSRLIDNYLTKIGEVEFTQAQFLRGILLWLGGFVGTALVSRIAKTFQNYFVNVMTQNIGTSLYQNTIAHTFSLPYEVFEDQQSGELLSKLVKAKDSIQQYITWLINIVFFALVGVVFVIWYSFFVDWRIALAYLALMPVMAWTSIRIAKKLKEAQIKISRRSNEVAWSITESVRNVSLIKMLGLVDQETSRLDRANQHVLDLELNKVKQLRSIQFLQWTITNAMSSSVIAMLWYLVYMGHITVGQLMSLYFYSFFVFGQLWRMGEVIQSYQEARANDEIIQDIMRMEPEPDTTTFPIVDHLTSLRLDKVSFGYDDKHVIKNINADWKSGQTVAFVGPSGAWKSTIIKLLAGLYFPTSGQVLMNGKPTSEINLNDFKHKLWIVSQDAQLFAGSIRDNLRFVAPEASEEDMIQVLNQASLYEFVEELEDWLDTLIWEWGLKLSGGQRQRLAIARALLRNPQILIFDEATSALDSIVEKEISDTIHDISKSNPDLMSVLVAHRLSTVMYADIIYVLEHWELVEQWTHDELLKLWGLYSAMWREQTGKK